MSDWITQIPEIAALDDRRGVVRVPPELDVPFTRRVSRLVDTLEFRRLARVTQLGLVSLVYPGAVHTRFEHALGVYRMALRYLRRLGYDQRFTDVVNKHDAEVLLVAALLHDVGHWPFCHPIEDIRLRSVPRHEVQARDFLNEESELARYLRDDWNVTGDEVLELLRTDELGSSPSNAPDAGRQKRTALLRSILSGPVDVDKMDYLQRDSLHAGVPYGRHFDERRLIGSLVVNASGDGLAISEKGKTAAEMMVFARYVMFSEVYWHHAVRSATAMLARAFYELQGDLDLPRLFRQTETEMIEALTSAAARRAKTDKPPMPPESPRAGSPPSRPDRGGAARLLDGIFGARRALYKRVAEYSIFQRPELYTRLARRPYPWLVRCATNLCLLIAGRAGANVSAGPETDSMASAPGGSERWLAPADILIDAPPVEREVEFNVEIYYAKESTYRPFAEVSPVVQTLARRQFDDYVKRVRVFVNPGLADRIRTMADFVGVLERAIAMTDKGQGS